MLGVYLIKVSFDVSAKIPKLFSKKFTYQDFHVTNLFFDVIADSEEDAKTKILNKDTIITDIKKQIYFKTDFSVIVEDFTETEREVKEIFPSLTSLLKYHPYDKVCKLISQQGVTLVDAIK